MNINRFLTILFATASLAAGFDVSASVPIDVTTRTQVLSSSAAKTAICMELLKSDKKLGEALYSYSKSSATLSSLFIKVESRHQGYGAKLFRLVCAMLKKKGCTVLTFNACPFESARNDQPYDLEKLVSFFENLGAHVVKYQDYLLGMPTTAVMAINL
jgi:predicted GNAT family acetyltransferase